MVQPYEVELLNAGIQPLPVLQVIVSRLLHASESMDLLLRLNRLPETQGLCRGYSFSTHVLEWSPDYLLLCSAQLQRQAVRTHCQVFYTCFKNVRSDKLWMYSQLSKCF